MPASKLTQKSLFNLSRKAGLKRARKPINKGIWNNKYFEKWLIKKGDKNPKKTINKLSGNDKQEIESRFNPFTDNNVFENDDDVVVRDLFDVEEDIEEHADQQNAIYDMRDHFARDIPDNNDLERTYRQIMRGVKNRNIEFGTHNINIEYQSGNGIRYRTVKYDVESLIRCP